MTKVLNIVFLWVFSSWCFGWNDAGHKLTAIIAYETMEKETQEKVLSILKRHPFFQRDFLNKMPARVKSAPSEIKNSWLFAQAAIWPDLIKRYEGEGFDQYRRDRWHYINFPVFANNAHKEKMAGKLNVNLARHRIQTKNSRFFNILQALSVTREQLNRVQTTDFAQAIWLCWYLHLVGDAHQPLHSVAMFTPDIFPEGDRGGGLLRAGSRNLHALWDAGAGKDTRHLHLVKKARQWLAASDKKNEKVVAVLSPEQWLKESARFARKHVYTESIKTTIVNAEVKWPNAHTVNVTLSSAYKKNIKSVAKNRIIAAGTRLENTLTTILASKKASNVNTQLKT